MSTPRFTTVIRAYGPSANVYAVLGTALNYMRQLDVPKEDRDALAAKVKAAGSYAAALDAVREWFPVDIGGE